MLPERLGVGHGVQVRVHDDLAIERDADVAAAAVNLLLIPLADRAERAALGGGDEIDGAVILGGLELGVFRIGVVEDLHLHAAVGQAALGKRRADGDAVVGPGLQLELEAEDEVAVVALREEVAAPALGAIQHPVLHAVAAPLAAQQLPAVQGLAIEDRQEAGLAVQGGATREQHRAQCDGTQAKEEGAGREHDDEDVIFNEWSEAVSKAGGCQASRPPGGANTRTKPGGFGAKPLLHCRPKPGTSRARGCLRAVAVG